jgi:hypothetical protein
MPSPFPGMNPWLEQEGLWLDFHTKFLTAINERLVGQVRPKYIVLIEQHIYVHEFIIQFTAQDVERVPYLEIRDRLSRELVTVLEMLGPSNKRGDDRPQYLAKRRQLLESSAHLIEIDLMRGGKPMPNANRPGCAYSVVVSRADRPRVGFWPIGLKERLPEIPIPLRKPDGDARVNLQEVLNHVYDVFGYENFVYAGSPAPALSPEDLRWATQVLGDLMPQA